MWKLDHVVSASDVDAEEQRLAEVLAKAGYDVGKLSLNALAQQVLALAIGGYNDWAIPARDQQELQYRNLKPTSRENYCWNRDGDNPNSQPIGLLYTPESPTKTTVGAFREGGSEAFQPTWYWSSSQRSAYGAFGMVFGGGYQGSHGKGSEHRVRPVRSELIID